MLSIKPDKQLLLAAENAHTLRVLSDQLREVLPDDTVIIPYSVNDTEKPVLSGHYYTVFSSQAVYKICQNTDLCDHIDQYLTGTRTISGDSLELLLSLPRNQEILLVSDSKETAMETVDTLRDMGFGYLHFRLCYPGASPSFTSDTPAVTTGDLSFVPPGIDKVYIMGVPLFDFGTVIRIMTHFHVLEQNIQHYAQLCQKKLFSFARRLADMAEARGEMTETVRTALLGKGYYAKYHFDDIIGRHPSMIRIKNSAEKIAKTDLTVLIEGENGTGKKLLASAIHNASGRKSQPFVTISFSAFPDDIIESELFGCAGETSDGNRKESRTGLFQQAEGGTVFLDEIGDMSLKMQAKLLHVLQEKEIIKVGGSRIIPVDIRIIAATSRDLQQMIRDNLFRKDLYYCLKESYLCLPPLAERKEDIPILIDHWLSTRFKSYKEISTSAMETLMRRDWPGNVRELLNVMKLALTISEKDIITTHDLPYNGSPSFDESSIWDPYACADHISLTILAAIHEINQRNEIAGRNRIYWFLKDNGIDLSEYKIRKRLTELSDAGLVSSTHGKYGLSLTDKGIMILENQKLR